MRKISNQIAFNSVQLPLWIIQFASAEVTAFGMKENQNHRQATPPCKFSVYKEECVHALTRKGVEWEWKEGGRGLAYVTYYASSRLD